MAIIKYTFKYTDTLKSSFDVFPYTANGPVSPTDPTPILSSGATTTLKLYGKGMPDYGEGVEQNLIYMLENFAGPVIPVNSTEGQVWYNNVGTGSPPAGDELFIRNSNVSDTLPNGWDAVILATGTSSMTGELTLAGNPTLPNHAITLSMLNSHAADFNLHLTADQNTFLDGLNLPTLTSSEVNELIGITGNVQTLLDGKLSLSGDTMTGDLELAFDPPFNLSAATKQYVDAQVLVAGDGVLDSTAWQAPAVGSPFDPTQFPSETTLVLTVTYPGITPDQDFPLYGISRVGHTHPANEVSIDTTGLLPPVYGGTVQDALEYVESAKADLAGAAFSGPVSFNDTINAFGAATFFGTVAGQTPSDPAHLVTKDYVDTLNSGSITRTFEQLSSDLTTGSPVSPYQVQQHTADDNKLSITINGLKQYVHSRASQQINYFGTDTTFAQTGIDHSLTYDFDISIDGGLATTITIIPSTSPEDLVFHNDLVVAINIALQLASVPAVFSINSTTSEIFITDSSGAGSSVAITDPTTANTYLFQNDPSPFTITNAEFGNILGSPTAPDNLIVSGDQTINFPAGQAFYVNGSAFTSGDTFDGLYRVYEDGISTGSTFDGLNTTIPIGAISDAAIMVPLIPSYIGGSPTPNPIPLGNIHLSPIAGLDNVSAAIAGIEGDYVETDSLGTPVTPGGGTSYAVFNYTIPATALIETLLIG